MKTKKEQPARPKRAGSMRARIRAFFTPPVFPDDEEKTRQARLLHTLLLSGMLLLILLSCIAVPFVFAEKTYNSIAIVVVFVIMGAAYWLVRNGRVRFASNLFLYGLWPVFVLLTAFAGGTQSVITSFFAVGAVIAGLLLGIQSALIYSALCCLAGLGMVFLGIGGHPLPRLFPVSPIVGWVDMTVVLLLTATIMNLALRSLREALALTRQRLEERKQAENALRESEERYRKLVSASPDGITIVGMDGRITYASPQVLELHGGLREEEVLGKSPLEWIAPAFREKARQAMADTFKRIFTPDREYLLLKKDGTTFWGEIHADALMDAAGQPIGMIAATRDINDRKQAEEALRESTTRYRTLVENTPDVIALFDKDAHYLFVNSAIRQVSPLKPEYFVGKTLRDVGFPKEQAEQRESLLRSVINSGKPIETELEAKTTSGSQVFEWRAYPEFDSTGNVQSVLVINRDITERKQVDKALRDSESRFRLLAENSTDIISQYDAEGNVLYISPACRTLLGYEPEELVGHHLFEFMHPDDIPTIGGFRSNISEQPIVSATVFRIRHKNGEYIWLETASHTVFDKETGAALEVQASSRDFTERKQAEEALRESEERFSRLSASTFEGIGITDQDRIVDANPQLAAMLGYGPGELIGKNSMDMVAPESRDLVIANMQAGIDGPYEHLAVKKDGTIFPVEIRARSISYGGHQARVAIIRDITERKRAEEALALQIERLSALHTIDQAVISSMDINMVLELLVLEIVEQLKVDASAVLLLNPQTQTLDFAANRGFRTEALKFTRLKVGTGLAGRAARQRKIVHVAKLAKLKNDPGFSKSIAEEKFVSYFGIPLIAKGQVLGVLEIFHRSPLAPDPNWLKFLETLAGQAAISIDNAHLLEMTQASLKETNALYRINQDLVATTDAEQLMKNVVALLQENFGYAYAQIFVADPETGDFVVRAGSGKVGEQLVSQGYRLAAGEGIVGYTAETGAPFFTNNANQVISFVRNPLLPDVQSELAVPIRTGSQFLGLIDIQQVPPAILTERDMQLVSAVADQLAVALQKAQLYADLQDSLRQEQATRSKLVQSEKLAVVGRLLASVSHELNNPMQAIQNALFLLKDERGLSDQGQQDLNIVLSETERMASLLERLRTTYQPALAEDFRPVQINNVIEDVHTLVATALRHALISFEFHPDPDLPLIPGLGTQLKQVLLNLFMNAMDAMSNGGRLIVSTRWLVEIGEVLTIVTDTGAGIDKSILPRIFEAFITNKEKGTGLGLAISEEIIIKHHGRIQAENNPGGGATFSIWLPVENGDSQ